MSGRIPWERDPKYPTKQAPCRVCGYDGTVKLAWDLQGYLCLDGKPCLLRRKRKNEA